ncbi:riboflavin biosynthesis protein RibD [Verrucomicrobiota bacterium]|nr:riboflavin biosynthesis protein RibD [Verrucomicrobiota bacterium]
MTPPLATDTALMRRALRRARRGFGRTSPNPLVGAVLVRRSEIIGSGWHHGAGLPHAEIEALRDAERRGHSPRGATLYVTLEPCCTHGRTPPCTDAIIAAGIRRVIAGATDPNPAHAGRGFELLRAAKIAVTHGVLATECERLNEAFNHWIVHRTPLVTVKAAMTLDGKIATASGDSKWITSEPARAVGMKLRESADAILVGINTILADNPSLTFRPATTARKAAAAAAAAPPKRLSRIILDAHARTPLDARVITDDAAALTTIVLSAAATQRRAAALAQRVRTLVAPVTPDGRIDLRWLLAELGREQITSLLVEGGGEVNASFLLGGFAQRIAFFYAPKILGGRTARKAVAGDGARNLDEVLNLTDLHWRQLGPDLLLTARVSPPSSAASR